MKHKEQTFKTFILSFILTFFSSVIYSDAPPKVDIPIQKEGDERSIGIQSGLSAAFDYMNLYIESTNADLELFIRLYDGLDYVIEEQILSRTSISISHLKKGKMYRLEIIVKYGEIWSGTFLFE